MTTGEKGSSLRLCLRHTWVPFFSRHGRLTAVQTQAIPRILDGKNVVIASPTASGKTEAVVVPTAERYVAEQWSDLAVLYIVPTRALANDTLERIAGPLRAMRMRVSLKHGDHPQLENPLPNWLITTPESLDSLICRRPEIFASVRTIILDEIHLLDNTYRGDQLRMLLWRLGRLVQGGVYSIHLLSATLSDPEDVARRYMSNFEIVAIPGHREIDLHFVQTHDEIKSLAIQNRWMKLLYFCNKRETVELVADELVELWRPYPVVAHHGALSREKREQAEHAMKRSRTAVGVATSTLEIGIDIGNIDLIVLAEIPWSISALLQRVGRGNRREGIVRAAAIVKSSDERLLLQTMVDAARDGALGGEPYYPDFSVVAQQVLSYAYQNPDGIPEDEFLSLLTVLCTEPQARLVLDFLRQRQWLTFMRGRWYRLNKLTDLGDRGEIHSNIPDNSSLRVIDIATGREIGAIGGVYDDIFLLARQAWQVVTIENGLIRARRFQGKATPAMFSRHTDSGKFSYLLPPSLR